ncbi:MAG: hypothetical protein OMM_14667, partial [Candidatus Magnetoglobus multicellularis str. Araruama]
MAKDMGDIRVDIEDINGTTAILNGYNPWDEQKGPGWYKWTSGVCRGMDINRDNVDPRPIRERIWWKGWDSEKQENLEVTKKLDLANIKNIQFCLGPGTEHEGTVYLDQLNVESTNYKKGKFLPKEVEKIKLYKSADYQQAYQEGEKINQDLVFVELAGKDGNPYTADDIWVSVDTTDKHPNCHKIK